MPNCSQCNRYMILSPNYFGNHPKCYECRSTPDSMIFSSDGASPIADFWEEQERYLKEDKIGKYRNHYYARYEGGKGVEIWKLNAEDVLRIILPKAKKQYPKKRAGNAKDPRIGVTISRREIHQYGVPVYKVAQ